MLKSISSYGETAHAGSRVLFDKMLPAKNFQSGLRTLRQIVVSMFDMRLHAEFAPAAKTSVNEFTREINGRFN
ncbi:M3 family metallopeptidase, partial [Burkholderia pseudomallei]|nr:M3 family metallopeptidase [Burkholderia pseudomallei]